MPARAAAPLTMPSTARLGEPGASLAGGEQGVIRAGVAAQRQQRGADGLGQQHLAHNAALAHDYELHLALVPGEHVDQVKPASSETQRPPP